MRLRTLINSGLLIALGLMAITSASLVARSSQGTVPRDEKQMPVVVEQLPLEEGVFPVEVRCRDARLSSRDTIEEFHCLVINNTNKPISAFSAAYTVITVEGDQESVNTSMLNIDSFVHADVREARRLKPVLPGASSTLQLPGPVTYENAVIKTIEVRMDYVEFEDKSSMGADKHGSRVINSMREGAAKYKTWLVQQYARNKNSETAIIPLLENSEIPKELQSGQDANLMEGAIIYCNAMRKVYNSQGAGELKRFLNR